jgi:hypothetical protein
MFVEQNKVGQLNFNTIKADYCHWQYQGHELWHLLMSDVHSTWRAE